MDVIQFCRERKPSIRLERQETNGGENYFLTRIAGYSMWYSCGDTKKEVWNSAAINISEEIILAAYPEAKLKEMNFKTLSKTETDVSADFVSVVTANPNYQISLNYGEGILGKVENTSEVRAWINAALHVQAEKAVLKSYPNAKMVFCDKYPKAKGLGNLKDVYVVFDKDFVPLSYGFKNPVDAWNNAFEFIENSNKQKAQRHTQIELEQFIKNPFK